MSKRHPSTESLLAWLTVNPRLPETPRLISGWCQSLSEQVTEIIPDDRPELTAGLRKLLEAKDCFVRAALTETDAPPLPLSRRVLTREVDGGAVLDVPRDVRAELIKFGWLPPVDEAVAE